MNRYSSALTKIILNNPIYLTVPGLMDGNCPSFIWELFESELPMMLDKTLLFVSRGPSDNPPSLKLRWINKKGEGRFSFTFLRREISPATL